MKIKKLEPETDELLKRLAQRGLPPVNTLDPEEARANRNPIFVEFGGPLQAVRQVEDLEMPGPEGNIGLRVYAPDGPGPFPVLVFFHGGGWVIGSLDTHDNLCRSLTNGASCIVVSVDYRLAPEHKFPAAAEDAYAAVQWVAENAGRINADSARIAVGGDSAGGNLAAAVSLMARDRGTPRIMHQVLIYPVLNLASFDTDSYRRHGQGYILTKESMEYYRGHYLQSQGDAHNPYASPLLAEALSGLPPAYVITAEVDVLTDEARAYAKRLNEAGVATTYRCYRGTIHPFVSFIGVLNLAREALTELSADLSSALRR